MNKVISRFIVLVMIFVMCFPCISYCTEAQNDNNANTTNNNTDNTGLSELKTKKDEIQKQIEENLSRVNYVQGEMTNSVEQVLRLNDIIDTSENEIKTLQTELAELQTRIDDVNLELAVVEKEYEAKSKLLENRLVALYEAGDTTYLDVLLTSRGLIDFISNCYMITELAESDSKIIDEVETQLRTIEVTKSKLDAEKAETKVKKAQMMQKSITLQNNRTIQNNYIAQLTENEKVLQEQIKQFKEEEAAVERQIALAVEQAGLGLSYPGGIMAWPCKPGTYITSAYGTREHPITGIVKNHTGIDIGNGGFGSPITAATDGIVTYAGWLGGYGNCIIIAHGDNISTLYGHGQKILVSVGQSVKRNDLIMEMGSTGQSTGPHLHFEVRENNKPVDPTTYLQ